MKYDKIILFQNLFLHFFWKANNSKCGGGEIRTHGPVAQTSVFKTDAIDHSATPPHLELLLNVKRL